MNFTSQTIRFRDVEWRLLTEAIESRFGLVFDATRREMLASRLAPRLEDLHLETFTEYYHYLLYHPNREKEYRELSRRVPNGESYFLRENHHFDILTRHVLPSLLPTPGGRPLRILSAGCSSGQEAYSIVMALQEAGIGAPGEGWEVDACDINPERLSQARQGLYSESSLRACDELVRARYFTRRNGKYELKPFFRRGLRFFEANLISESGYSWGTYDTVFCRNVLIYFSDTGLHAAVDLFSRCLVPGGFLILGHSESLINKRDDFQPVCFDGRIIYRKEGNPSSGSS